jgi:hypothetical protein
MIQGFPYLKSKTDCTWFFVLLIVLILGYLFYPKIKMNMQPEKFTSSTPHPAENYSEKLTPPEFEGVCSPQCCLQSQWPVDFMPSSKIDFAMYENTGLHCRSCEGTGCLCQLKGTLPLSLR